MNGPTRSKAFERRVPVGRMAGGADAWPDEMDQFVDSEPLAWTGAPRSERRASFSAADEPEGDASASPATTNEARVHVGGPLTAAAGMRLWAEDDEDAGGERPAAPPDDSPRRDAFSQRLSNELSRPPPTPPAASAEPQAPAPPAEDTPQVTAEPADAVAPGPAEEAAPQETAAPAEPERPWRAAIAKAADEGRTTDDVRKKILARRATPSLATPKAPAPAPAPAARTEAPAPSPPPPPPPPPETEEARLERELDDAIGAIITGRPAAAGEPDVHAAPSFAPVTSEVEPPSNATLETPVATPAARDEPSPVEVPPAVAAAAPGPSAEPAPAEPDTATPTADARPARVVGGRRPKGVPTFTFNRRPEAEPEPFPRAPADVDEPLAGIYLPDERLGGHGRGPITSELDADAEHYEAAALPDDDYDALDPFVDEDEPAEADVLPASLRGRGRAKARPSARSAGIAAAVVGAGAITLLAVIGFNVFAGAGTPATEPRIITADATDVKVRPETVGISAEPDIGERARVGETGTLVVPDDVPLSSVRRAAPATEEGIVSRPVRTVVVRPDGTLLPSDTGARASRTATPREDAPDTAAPSRTVAPPREPQVAAVRDVVPPQDPVTERVAADPLAEPVADNLDDEPIGESVDVAIPRRRPTPPVRTGATTVAAAPQSVAAPAPVQSAPVQNAPWSVQVSSQRSRADAQTAFRGLQERYGSILGNVTPLIVAADVPGRGRFYRVRVPAASQREAATLCQRLKSAGADCFVGRN